VVRRESATQQGLEGYLGADDEDAEHCRLHGSNRGATMQEPRQASRGAPATPGSGGRSARVTSLRIVRRARHRS
jgi:hypothetical protein